MAAKGIKALLVTRREDVRYLTGFTGSTGTVLVTPARQYFVTDFRYMLQARRETSGITILIQKKDWVSAVHDAAERSGVGTVWFDESSVLVDALGKLKKTGLRLRGCRDAAGELRQRKDAREIASIRKAVRRAEESFRELKKDIRPGATEQELGLKLEYLMRGKGARKAAFDTIVASGRNGAMPHAATTNRRIKKGDLVTFDFGAEADGYFSDITRTICVGRPSSKQREIHGLVMNAQAAAIRMVRPGTLCKVVDEAARGMIKKAGHAKHFGHSTGHGVGLMVHEGPAISPSSKAFVEQGMVFTVEPGVYIPGWGGVRIEDMVLVTGSGVTVLTTLPRELLWSEPTASA
jgi:Xaa-Pro aminopeptidase